MEDKKFLKVVEAVVRDLDEELWSKLVNSEKMKVSAIEAIHSALEANNLTFAPRDYISKYNPTYEELFFRYKEDEETPVEECPEHALILAKLLADELMFVGNIDTGPFFKSCSNPPDSTVCAWLNCNDLFAWGCADMEPVLMNELPDLYKAHMEDDKWGSVKWCCKHRNLKPQKPIRERMKEAGVWDEEMESLEDNFE
jgi:hypothetical protein